MLEQSNVDSDSPAGVAEGLLVPDCITVIDSYALNIRLKSLRYCTMFTYVLLACLALLACCCHGWVAKHALNISVGGQAQSWPVVPLGPGGSRPFKFVPGGMATLSVLCSVVSQSAW